MHIDSIDFLKGLAIIGVITLHSFTSYGIFEILVLQSVPIFIILMGLNGALSLNRTGFILKDYLEKKCMRIILPLIPVFFITLFIAFNLNTKIKISPLFILGQMPIYGPGNYFIGLILQSLVAIPILWWLSKKDTRLMLIISFGISFISEILYYYYSFPPNDYLYELLIFRWLFAFAIGIALVDTIVSKKISFVLKLGISISTALVLFLGITHIKFLTYPGYSLGNVFTFLFPAGIIIGVIFLGISWKPIDLFGKASYHIFLTQMVYFIIFHQGYILNLVISIGLGILFYFSDLKFQSLIKSFKIK